MLDALIATAPILLTLSLFIETSSWWVRSLSPTGSVGLYVSRSNIYLYGGRFFALGFTSVTAYWIESGASPSEIAGLIGWSLIAAALVQIMLLHPMRLSDLVMRVLTIALRLPPRSRETVLKDYAGSTKLFVSTAAASAIFGIGLGLPLVAAVLVPEYRLSVSYLGQIVNSIGTLVILFLVDQLLFRALDDEALPAAVRYYGVGRFVGFVISGLVFVAAGASILPS